MNFIEVDPVASRRRGTWFDEAGQAVHKQMRVGKERGARTGPMIVACQWNYFSYQHGRSDDDAGLAIRAWSRAK